MSRQRNEKPVRGGNVKKVEAHENNKENSVNN